MIDSRHWQENEMMMMKCKMLRLTLRFLGASSSSSGSSSSAETLSKSAAKSSPDSSSEAGFFLGDGHRI